MRETAVDERDDRLPFLFRRSLESARPSPAGLAVIDGLLRLRPFVIQYRTMSTSLGALELAALLAVARLGSDAYGLAVRRVLADRLGRDYSVGAVYTTLQRLEDKGLLRSRASDPLPVRGGRSRRHFTLTAAGTRALREAERRAASLWDGLGTPIRPEPA